MSETIAIRFDVSSSIGSGHLRRAITIGNELAKRRFNHRFVTPSASCATAISLGVPKERLIGFDAELGEKNWIQQIPELTHVITDFCHHENRNSGLVIEQILQSKQLLVAVIDSMPPYHFQGDKDARPMIVVTPYFGAENLREIPHCNKWLAGAKYSILDSTFLTIHQALEGSSLTAGDYILVCCGGSDPNQMSEYILDMLLKNKVPSVKVKVVIGNLFEKSRVESLNKVAYENNKFISIVRNRKNIADLIENCGVLIGLVGLIRYESACLGKPSYLVQNHGKFEQYLRSFHNSGLGNIYLIQNKFDRKAFESIVEILGTVDGFREMSKPNTSAFDQIDGRGCQRFLDVFLN